MSPAAVGSRLAGHVPYAGRDGTAVDGAAAVSDEVSPFMTMQNDGRIPSALRQSSASFNNKDAYSYTAGVQAMQQDHIAATAQRPPVPRRSSETGTAQRRSTAGGDQQAYGMPAVVPFMPLSSGWNSVDDELGQELSIELHKQKQPQHAADQGHRFAPCLEQQQIWEQDSWGMFTGHMKQQQQQQPQQQQQQQQPQLQQQQSASGTPRQGRLHKLLSSLHLPQGRHCRLASHGSRGPASPHKQQQHQQHRAVCSPAVSPHSHMSGTAVSPVVSNSTGSSTSRHSSPFAWCHMRLSDDGTSAVPGGIAGVRVPVAPLSPVASQSCPSSPFGSQPGSLRAAAVPAAICHSSVSGPAGRQPSTAAGRIVSDPGGPPIMCMLSVSAEAEAQLLQQLSAPSGPPQQQQPAAAAPVAVPQADPRSGGSFNRHACGSGRHSHRLVPRRSSLDHRCPLRSGLARCQLHAQQQQQHGSANSPKLEVSTSLRTALVQLEHTASVHANRLRERLHCGLARLTSFSPQAEGVLRLPVGREVLRDWEFGPEIGSGASCVTRLVQSRLTGEPAACKTINKSGIFRSAALKAAMLGVQRELAIMQHTSGHPHVVQLRGIYEDARALHLVMDWCAGGCLEALVAYKLPEGKLQEPAAAAVAKAVLEVLAHVHERGVVHRDIKPGNVLLCSLNEDAPGELTTDCVKVTDFGISVPFTPGRPLTELAGTMEYLAPEVLQRCYSTAADVWSTGVMLHELLCGQLPFQGDTLEQMAQCIQKTQVDLSGPAWAGVSHEAKQLVALCLQKDPRDRPTARQLLDTFAAWLELGSGL